MGLLLVEDEAELAELVANNLRRDGFAVDVAGRIGDARAALSTTAYELVLLDLRLPDGDGLGLIRWLRREECATPIIVLTARDRLRDRIDGLNAGADDYLVKPFAHEELVARARAVLRRPATVVGRRLAIANLTLEPTNGEVCIDGGRVNVPRHELAILGLLMRRAGHIVSRAAIEGGICDHSEDVGSNALEASVSRLRRRLGAAGARIEIVGLRGSGYVLKARAS